MKYSTLIYTNYVYEVNADAIPTLFSSVKTPGSICNKVALKPLPQCRYQYCQKIEVFNRIPKNTTPGFLVTN